MVDHWLLILETIYSYGSREGGVITELSDGLVLRFIGVVMGLQWCLNGLSWSRYRIMIGQQNIEYTE